MARSNPPPAARRPRTPGGNPPPLRGQPLAKPAFSPTLRGMKRTLPLVLTLAALAVAVPAFAQAGQAGQNLYDTLVGLVQGNVGRTVGLLLVVYGLFTAIFRKDWLGGLLIVVGGALLTAAPEIFQATENVVDPVVQSLSSGY